MLVSLRQVIERLRGDESGAAFVEMALVTPFVLLLSAGVFEFANIMHTRLLLEAGVEDAARYIARCSDTAVKCDARGKNLAVYGAPTGGSVRVSGWSTVSVTRKPYPAIADDGTQLYLSSTGTVDVIEVSTELPYGGVGFWAGYLGFGVLTIKASHQERFFGW